MFATDSRQCAECGGEGGASIRRITATGRIVIVVGKITAFTCHKSVNRRVQRWIHEVCGATSIGTDDAASLLPTCEIVHRWRRLAGPTLYAPQVF